ncbi:copper resistance protein CopC [Bacillus atrophaeus]|uniref:copper resistance CopC/CopD family protein n=1 Tax=Bacillus atrophaeus TaxID=1452 RepID=UPI002281FF5A|nr:copper resistance protein CopC [Bacillus atrophaeus]MCY7945219.1 copper resistance CopC/CopD family protein [Bacillus atrophaeus]MCY8094792.1 copper resistance CopC/CopD family protein [Bacillus atrophaeus]MCY9169771.1 copper resistance CopC/CopD family protein [Bacillus atrophaeus]MDQ0926269.1 copper transport protein [Bacillus atrophaeus]MEC0743310.1 copper resistance protein CopC [Bacillus atrophaeus]
MKRNRIWIILLLFLVFIPKTSFAHAYIVNSTPSENSELKKAPSQVEIEFNEPVEEGFHYIKVYNSSGERVDKDHTDIKKDNKHIMITKLKKNLPHDIYRAEWNAVSADGHPVSGVIPFSIGKADGGFGGQKASGSEIHPETAIDRAVLYTAFSLFIGTVLFHLVWFKAAAELPVPLIRRTRNILILSVVCMGLALLLQLPIQTKANAGGGWAAALQAGYLKETLLQTAGGAIWMIQIGLYALLVLSVIPALRKKRFDSFKYWTAPLIFFFGLLLAKAFTGHAAVVEEKAVGVLMDFLHLSSASIWVGGIAALTLLLWNEWKHADKTLAWETVKRFSPWALVSVGVILFSGLLNGFFIIRSMDSLFHTAYGQTLLLKSGLFVMMLIFGAIHYISTRKPRQKGIGRTIKAEWAIGIAVLITAAVFTSLPSPPEPVPEPFFQSKAIEKGQMVSLSISPNQPGKNEFDLRVTDHNGDPVKDIQQISITVYKTGLSGNQNKSTFQLKESKQGVFEAENLSINEKGNWKVKVHGLTGDFNEINIMFSKTN